MKQLYITLWWLICSITPVFFNPYIVELLYNQVFSSFLLGMGLLFIYYRMDKGHGLQITALFILTTIFAWFNVLIMEELKAGGYILYDSSDMVYNTIIGLELAILIPCSASGLWTWYKDGLSGSISRPLTRI